MTRAAYANATSVVIARSLKRATMPPTHRCSLDLFVVAVVLAASSSADVDGPSTFVAVVVVVAPADMPSGRPHSIGLGDVVDDGPPPGVISGYVASDVWGTFRSFDARVELLDVWGNYGGVGRSVVFC